MPQASFWFSSPFREWIGQRSLVLTWDGRITLREIWERLAADHPKLRANLPREGIQEEAMSHLTAVIVDGDILTLDAEIKDGAKVDVLTPLSGGRRRGDRDRDARQRGPTATGISDSQIRQGQRQGQGGSRCSAFPHGSRLAALDSEA